MGCNGLEDWLLDNVDVPKLLPLLKKGSVHSLGSTATEITADCRAKLFAVLYNLPGLCSG